MEEPPSATSLDDDVDGPGLSLDEPAGDGDGGVGAGDDDKEQPSHLRPIKADEHRNAATREHMETVRTLRLAPCSGVEQGRTQLVYKRVRWLLHSKLPLRRRPSPHHPLAPFVDRPGGTREDRAE